MDGAHEGAVTSDCVFGGIATPKEGRQRRIYFVHEKTGCSFRSDLQVGCKAPARLLQRAKLRDQA